jgi:multimeric flavodoxin WrbA
VNSEPRQVKIELLGICGSPRKGNSLFLLEQCLDAAVKAYPNRVTAETYIFGHTSFAPCDACQAHIKLKGECRIQDGFQELRDKWLDAEAIIYSVPVYHMGIPGQVKCFIDRLGNSFGYRFQETGSTKPAFYMPRFMKAIGSISQGSHMFAGQEHAQAFINMHALLMRCIPVAGDIWESYIGAGGWTETSHKLNALKALADEGKIDAQVAIRSAKSLGIRVVETALIIKSGLMANASLFSDLPPYRVTLKKIQEE